VKKAHDSGCCCIKCEGMNELRRGCNGAAAKLLDVIKRLHNSCINFRTMTLQLEAMKEILCMSSKYDCIVACLAPCLGRSDKLEGANFECINGNECSKCGFQQLWSGGVRNSLLTQNDELQVNAILAGPEWKKSKIHWRHYTQQVADTIFQDDDDSNEYSPSDGNNARNLVLETAIGNLVEFLDKYEEMTEKMPIIGI